MTLHLYNTQTRTKEPFVPLDPGHVRMYVCGPTVYNHIHVGNARPVVVFDLLYRLLQHAYPRVTYVRNITDVDDKIIQAAAGGDIQSLTLAMEEAFQDVSHKLGSLSPTHSPRATQHIDDMVRLIQSLIEKGYAYEAAGHVLFDVAKFKDYGALSGISLEDMKAGARVGVEDYKRSAHDFVLWKPAAQGDVGWESPFGYGRPGWHIECSAMCQAFLGETFDIHGGGIDLAFPHHENERAQSMCGHGTAEMARFWMHNGHVNMGGDKMSKSTGNLVRARDILADEKGEVVRYALLSAQYRQPLEWHDGLLSQARQNMDRFYRALEGMDNDAAITAMPPQAFMNALEDDLNTPQAFAVLHGLVGEIHRADPMSRPPLQASLYAAGRLMGFFHVAPDVWFQSGGEEVDVKEIETLIQKRNEARAARDFATADAVREQLSQQGIVLEDGAQGTTWRKG